MLMPPARTAQSGVIARRPYERSATISAMLLDILTVVIAGIAVGFSGLSWWASNKSANAAVASSVASRDAVKIASEAEHEKQAPQWEKLEVDPHDDGGCTIRAFYVKGPPAVDVEIGYYGSYKSGSAHGKEIVKITHRTEKYGIVTKREPIKLSLDLPIGWDSVSELDLYVTYISRILGGAADEKNWFDASHLHWRRETQTIS